MVSVATLHSLRSNGMPVDVDVVGPSEAAHAEAFRIAARLVTESVTSRVLINDRYAVTLASGTPRADPLLCVQAPARPQPDASLPPDAEEILAQPAGRVTVADLRAALADCDPSAEVRLASQAPEPTQAAVAAHLPVVQVEVESDPVAFLTEGAPLGGLPSPARQALHW